MLRKSQTEFREHVRIVAVTYFVFISIDICANQISHSRIISIKNKYKDKRHRDACQAFVLLPRLKDISNLGAKPRFGHKKAKIERDCAIQIEH